ncbi:MAG: Planctomycete cytochrome [Verrucomicrobiaceae bacterium]|nr:Planctomycete cytochrome [Verrucomicrobiaceae bacterium]
MKLSFYLLSLIAIAASHPAFSADPPVDFERQIKPVIADRCVECHNSENLMGGLSLENHEHAMRERKQGAVIVPKVPGKSLLYVTLTLPVRDNKAMPATAHRLPHDEIEAIRHWILEGATWPDGKVGEIAPRRGRAGNR